MSNRSKGNKCEKWAENYLTDRGWQVHRARQTGYQTSAGWMSRSNDVFGLYDLVAIKPDQLVRFIQVTMDSGVSKRRKMLVEASPRFPHDHARSMLWVWTDGRPTGRSRVRQTWRIYEIGPGGYVSTARPPSDLQDGAISSSSSSDRLPFEP